MFIIQGVKMEENDMTSEKYLGYIRKQKSFFNFYPVARVFDNAIEEVSSEEARKLFPQHGGFCLVKDFYRDNITKNLIDNYFYVIDLEDGDLIEYTDQDGLLRGDYEYKLNDFHSLVKRSRFAAIDRQQAYFVPDRQCNFDLPFVGR